MHKSILCNLTPSKPCRGPAVRLTSKWPECIRFLVNEEGNFRIKDSGAWCWLLPHYGSVGGFRACPWILGLHLIQSLCWVTADLNICTESQFLWDPELNTKLYVWFCMCVFFFLEREMIGFIRSEDPLISIICVLLVSAFFLVSFIALLQTQASGCAQI